MWCPARAKGTKNGLVSRQRHEDSDERERARLAVAAHSRRKRTVCNSTRTVHKKRRVPFTPGDVVSLGPNVVGKNPTRLILVLAVISCSWRPVRWSGDRAVCDVTLLVTVDGRLLLTTLLSSDMAWHTSARLKGAKGEEEA